MCVIPLRQSVNSWSKRVILYPYQILFCLNILSQFSWARNYRNCKQDGKWHSSLLLIYYNKHAILICVLAPNIINYNILSKGLVYTPGNSTLFCSSQCYVVRTWKIMWIFFHVRLSPEFLKGHISKCVFWVILSIYHLLGRASDYILV